MSTLQETPTPALVIHRHGSRQYCVLPAGVDPNGDVARDQYLLISSRKACEAFVRERLAIEEARAAAPAQNGHTSSEDPESYATKVRQAYRELAEQRRNPDVSIHELYRRVGGELAPFHAFLHAEAHENRVAPSAGEPTLASEEAKRSALTLPGEVDRVTGKPLQFLNVKLFEAPEQAREAAPQPQPEPEVAKAPELQYAVTLTASDLELLRQTLDDQARTLAGGRGADQQVERIQAISDLTGKLEGLQPQQAVQQPPESGRVQALEAFVQKVYDSHGLYHDGTLYEESKRLVQPAGLQQQQPEPKVEQPELPEYEQYRKELVERARKAYPNASPELAAKIDKEINRRVEMVKGYQAHLEKTAADSFPNATPAEKAAHQANIRREVVEYRVALEKHIQQQRENRQQQREQAQHQPPPSVRARAQQQHLGYSR